MLLLKNIVDIYMAKFRISKFKTRNVGYMIMRSQIEDKRITKIAKRLNYYFGSAEGHEYPDL